MLVHTYINSMALRWLILLLLLSGCDDHRGQPSNSMSCSKRTPLHRERTHTCIAAKPQSGYDITSQNYMYYSVKVMVVHDGEKDLCSKSIVEGVF